MEGAVCVLERGSLFGVYILYMQREVVVNKWKYSFVSTIQQ